MLFCSIIISKIGLLTPLLISVPMTIFIKAFAEYNESSNTFNMDIKTIEKTFNSLLKSNVMDFNNL